MIIRKYEEKDRKNVQKVCIETAPNCNTDAKKALTLALYCDYYLDFEGGDCFVCATEDGEAGGYIMCAPDYARYEKMFTEHYLNKLKKIKFGLKFYKKSELKAMRKFAADYPAHLHIDISAEYQRQGVGHMLMDALIVKLKADGVKGVFLGCGANNTKGCNFYRKYGFTEIRKMPGSIIFAMKINNAI